MEFRQMGMVPRFQLDRRPGRSRLKMRCPQCGKERSLTPYIDVKTGQPVGPEFGRCDHERKCGYDKRPTGKDIGEREIYISNNEARRGFQIPEQPDIANCIPYPEWARTINPDEGNIMFRFLARYWDRSLVSDIFRRYNVGTMAVYGWQGCSVFWQVDKDFVCRSAKIMEYGIKEVDGEWKDIKRVKEGENEFPHVTFYHALKSRDYVFRQCLFGEHLLNFYPETQTVHLVEAEKTAIIASINRPDKLFLATGGLQNLRPEVMGCLRRRKVVAYPDKGEAYNTWQEKIRTRLMDYDITVSDYLQNMDIVGDGDDMADVIIKKHLNEIGNGKI